jgi:tetratricopeptide (TPR) repeat protein
MKVVHIHKEEAGTSPANDNKGWLARAREAEEAGKPEEAATAYEKVIKADRLNEQAYNRLMVIYRKLKEYQKELKVVNAGIAAYEKFYASHVKVKSKRITALSKKLNKAVGLTDKKGNNLYAPEPLARWKKRKQVVQKRLNQ